MKHLWFICEMCGPYVRCGYCGNNCCNGGTGELPSGDPCGCKEAYKQQDEKIDIPEKMCNWKPNSDLDFDSLERLIE